MVITPEEMNRRLNSGKNLQNKLNNKTSMPAFEFPIPDATASVEPQVKVIEIPTKTNAPQIKDDVLRSVIGSLASQGESVKQIAKDFNVTPNQVISAKNSPKPEIKDAIRDSMSRVKELALDKLMLSLNLMTPDKFDAADLKTLSIVSSNMSRVIDKLTPRDANSSNTQLIVYAPQMKDESKYKVIDV